MADKNYKRLKKYNQDQAAAFAKLWAVWRVILSNLDNITSTINRYIPLASTLQSLFGIVSMLPLVLGPIGVVAAAIQLLENSELNLAAKIIGLSIQSSASITNIISLFLQTIAAPLIIVSSALYLFKEIYSSAELMYRHFYKNEKISSYERNATIHDTILAAISLTGAILFVVFPPAGYVVFILIGAYKLLDVLDLNPLKKLTNWFDKEPAADEEKSITAPNTAPLNQLEKLFSTEKDVAKTQENKNEKASTATNAVPLSQLKDLLDKEKPLKKNGQDKKANFTSNKTFSYVYTRLFQHKSKKKTALKSLPIPQHRSKTNSTK